MMALLEKIAYSINLPGKRKCCAVLATNFYNATNSA